MSPISFQLSLYIFWYCNYMYSCFSSEWPMTGWCLVTGAVIQYLFYLLYCTHFKPFCEDRIINFFTGFLKMSVNVSVFLGALNIKLHVFLWIKRSIWICFTDGRVILTATRKTLVVKFLVSQSGSLSYDTGRCRRPVLISFSCSTESSAVLHSPMLSGTWKNVPYI